MIKFILLSIILNLTFLGCKTQSPVDSQLDAAGTGEGLSVYLNKSDLLSYMSSHTAQQLSMVTYLDIENQGAEKWTPEEYGALKQFTGLESLSVTANGIDGPGAKAIAESRLKLRTLEIGHNAIGLEGARAIAVGMKGLAVLNVESNNLGPEDAKVIAEHLPKLQGNRVLVIC